MKKTVVIGGLAVVALAAIYPLVAKESRTEAVESAIAGTAEAALEPAADANALVATVNGEPVTKDEVRRAVEASFAARGMQLPDINALPAPMRKGIIESYVSEKLILEKARKAGVGADPEVQKEIQQASNRILAKAYLKNAASELVNEEAIQAEYKDATQKMAKEQEVHARHILVENEEEAKAIAQSLKDGSADFEALAKEKSKDSSNSEKGGDLGYFTKGTMVPEFADAAFALEIGKVSEPVKTDFGWHIIKVEDKRDKPVPTLEVMRPAIVHTLENEAVNGIIDKALTEANVTYYQADGKPYVEGVAEAPAQDAGNVESPADAEPAAGGQSIAPASDASEAAQPKE